MLEARLVSFLHFDVLGMRISCMVIVSGLIIHSIMGVSLSEAVLRIFILCIIWPLRFEDK